MKQFGETVEGYHIPVLNEREIRGAAGILFLFTLISFLKIIFTGDFVMLKYFISFFMLDMGIRVFINPKYSPTLTIGRFMTRNQTPLYVGAAQKKFAWQIGLTLSTAMFIHIVLLNAYGPITGLSCLICMVLMFFELAFGICIGCKIYGLFHKKTVQYCPGEVCEVKDRHEIQNTTWKQWLVVPLFALLLFGVYHFFNDDFLVPTRELTEVIASWRK